MWFATLLSIAFALGASSTASAHGTSGIKVVDRKGADAGERVTLLKTSDFKVTGECVDNGGDDFTADTFLAARRNNLMYSAYRPGIGFDDSDVDFDKGDKLDITSSDASGTDPAIEAAEYYEFYAEDGAGRPLRGRIETTVHRPGADCGFSGVFTGVPGPGPLRSAKRVKVNVGESVGIYKDKDFKVVGSCEDDGGNDFAANTFLKARRGGAMYYLTEANQADTDFGPGDGPVDITPDSYDPDGTLPYFQGWSYYNDFFAVGKAGNVLQARLGGSVHARGADCTFSGIFTGPRSGKDILIPEVLKVGEGKAKTLFANKDFKVTARCLGTAGNFTADTTLKAKRSKLAFYAYAGTPGSDVNFGPGDGPIDITSEDAGGTVPDFRSNDQYTDFYGEGRGGKVVAGRIASGVHVKGADCIFTGYFAG